MTDNFSFTFQAGESFEGFVKQAAAKLPSALANLGGGDASAGPTAQQIADLGRNVARLPENQPLLTPIRPDQFVSQGLGVPARLRDQNRKSTFYWVEFPLVLQPYVGHRVRRVERNLRLATTPPGAALFRSVLPDQKFVELLSGKTGATLKLAENMEFSATTPSEIDDFAKLVAQGKAKASVEVSAAAEAGLVAGPFEYRVRKAKIEHSPNQTNEMFWRVDGEEFFEGATAEFVAILEVPKTTTTLVIDAAVQTAFAFQWWSSDLSVVFDQVSDRLRGFIEAGAPRQDAKSWDVSAQLANGP